MKESQINGSEPLKPIKFKAYIHFIVAIMLLIFLCFYIREQIDLANMINYKTASLFKRIRYGHHNGLVENSLYVKIFCAIIEAVTLVFSYIFLYNTVLVYHKFKLKNLVFLFPLVIYIVYQVFSAARSGFIQILTFLLILALLLISKKYKIRLFSVSVVLLVVLILYLVVFSLLGSLTEKVTNENFFEQINIYAGSSIVAFNQFMKNYSTSGESTETFTGLINLFYSLSGAKKEISYSLEYVFFTNGSTTNIYTAFRSYIHDFGVVGMLVIQWLTGAVFGYWNKLNAKKFLPLSFILYSYYLYNIILLLFTPNLTSSFLTVGRISTLIFICISYKIFIRRNGVQS